MGAWARYAADTELLTTAYHTTLFPDPRMRAAVPIFTIGPADHQVEFFDSLRLTTLWDDVREWEQVQQGWQPAVQAVNVGPMTAYRWAREDLTNSRDAALVDLRSRLDNAKATYAQRSPREVATELGDELGVGQLVIARAVGVTPTAVRKWRRGEAAIPEHRDRLAKFAALSRLLTEEGLHDPAGWIEIPISLESTLTPLDLFIGGRADLVVLFGAGLADTQGTLDAFDGEWRTSFARDHDYEVVTLADGSRSVLPRREASH
jgi:DNA-binding transcriptional regulator YiaG